MAKKRASGKKPRTIPDEIFKSMSSSQRAEAMRQVGAKAAAGRIIRTDKRSEHAGKVKYRSAESARTAQNARSYAQKMADTPTLMREGGKRIMSYNRKRLTERTVKGKPQLTAGGQQRLDDLQAIIRRTLDDAIAKATKQAMRAAKKVK